MGTSYIIKFLIKVRIFGGKVEELLSFEMKQVSCYKNGDGGGDGNGGVWLELVGIVSLSK